MTIDDDRVAAAFRSAYDALLTAADVPPDWDTTLEFGMGTVGLNRQTRRRSGWLTPATAAVGAAVVVLASIGSVAWFGRPNSSDMLAQPPTTMSGAPQPGTAPTEPTQGLAPVASPLPLQERIPLRLLAVRPTDPSLVMIDLEQGTLTLYPPGAHALPGGVVDGAVMTPDGQTLIWKDESVSRFEGPLDRLDGVLQPASSIPPPGIAPSLAVVPTPDSSTVWLVQPGIDCCGSSQSTLAELIDLSTGRQILRAELDPSASPVGASHEGLIFNTSTMVESADGWVPEAGSERVLLLSSTTGVAATIGPGVAIAGNSSTLARLVCDAPETTTMCDLRLSDPNGNGERTVVRPPQADWITVGGPPIPSEASPLPTVSPDGSQLLIGTSRGEGDELQHDFVLWVVDLNDGKSREMANLSSAAPLATWSRDGQWIVVVDDSDLRLIDAEDPNVTVLVPSAIPEEHFPLAAG